MCLVVVEVTLVTGKRYEQKERGNAATSPSSLASPTPGPDFRSSLAYQAVPPQCCLPPGADPPPVYLRRKGKPVGRRLLSSGPLGMLGAGERQNKGRKPASSHLPTSRSGKVCFNSCDEILHIKRTLRQ